MLQKNVNLLIKYLKNKQMDNFTNNYITPAFQRSSSSKGKEDKDDSVTAGFSLVICGVAIAVIVSFITMYVISLFM